MTLSIVKPILKSFSIMTLSRIMTLGQMTLIIFKIFRKTFQKILLSNTHQNDIQLEMDIIMKMIFNKMPLIKLILNRMTLTRMTLRRYISSRGVLLCVIRQSVVLLNVTAPKYLLMKSLVIIGNHSHYMTLIFYPILSFQTWAFVQSML